MKTASNIFSLLFCTEESVLICGVIMSCYIQTVTVLKQRQVDIENC